VLLESPTIRAASAALITETITRHLNLMVRPLGHLTKYGR